MNKKSSICIITFISLIFIFNSIDLLAANNKNGEIKLNNIYRESDEKEFRADITLNDDESLTLTKGTYIHLDRPYKVLDILPNIVVFIDNSYKDYLIVDSNVQTILDDSKKETDNPNLTVIKASFDGKKYIADIKYKNDIINVDNGTIIDSKYKIINIQIDSVLVYSYQDEKILYLKDISKKAITKTQNAPKVKVIYKSGNNNINDRRTDDRLKTFKVLSIIEGKTPEETVANIVYQEKEMQVKVDFILKGSFKVLMILPDRVVIYSLIENRRRTFVLEDINK